MIAERARSFLQAKDREVLAKLSHALSESLKEAQGFFDSVRTM